MEYYKKKLKAIIPAYWVVLLIMKLLTDDVWYTWKSLLKTMLFIDCPGHFWYIQQTVLMYFVTPLIFILLQCIGKCVKDIGNRYLVQTVALLGLSILVHNCLTVNVFYLLGNGKHQPFWIWAYFIGMAFGLFYKYLSQKRILLNNEVASIIGMVLLAFPILSASCFLGLINPNWSTYLIGWNRPMLCVYLAGALLIVLALNQQSLGAKILSWKPLIKLGDISYETYIIHWFFLWSLPSSSHHYKNFIMVYIVTICVSVALKKVLDGNLRRQVF